MESQTRTITNTLYALNGLPVELVTIGSTFTCPECGSFLDAPRIHPESDRLARKCPPCQDWYLLADLHDGD
jgi:hypothetical protein